MAFWSRLFSFPRTKPEKPGVGAEVARNRVAQGGVYVDEQIALTYSAVWAAVQKISQTIAGLPWPIFERGQNGDRLILSDIPLARLLSVAPNPEMDAFIFREVIIAHALTWGNGYAEIERDMAGRPIGLWLLPPDRVDPARTPGGQLYYKVRNGPNGIVEIPSRDMFHLKGPGFDGLRGYNVISYAARSIGGAIATERFGSAFFANGATFGGAIKHPGKLSPEAKKNIREPLEEGHTGPSNAHRFVIFDEGMDYIKFGVDPEAAQFLETRKANVRDIARWFNIPPHKIGDLENATFSNIEHQAIEFVQDTILPWTRRLEMEVRVKLLNSTPRRDSRLNLRGLLRGDMKARAEYYQIRFNLGSMSPNDIRHSEDENSIPGGEQYFVNSAVIPLQMAGRNIMPTMAANKIFSDLAETITDFEMARIAKEQKRCSASALPGVMREFFTGQVKVIVDKFLPQIIAFAEAGGFPVDEAEMREKVETAALLHTEEAMAVAMENEADVCFLIRPENLKQQMIECLASAMKGKDDE